MPCPQHVILQAEGPECPFGLLFAPCRRAEVRSRAGNAAEVACRGASAPLDGTASRWHEARSKAEGANTHGSLQGNADAPLPGRMSPCKYMFEKLAQKRPRLQGRGLTIIKSICLSNRRSTDVGQLTLVNWRWSTGGQRFFMMRTSMAMPPRAKTAPRPM